MNIFLYQTTIENDIQINFNHFKTIFTRNFFDLFLAPELFLTGFDYKNINTHSTKNAEYLKIIQDLCLKYNKAFCGSFFWHEKNKYFNRSFFINNKGKIISTYDKVHLIPALNEDKYLTAGKKEKTLLYNDFLIGLSICYDLRFPEFFRKYAKKETHLIIVQAEWPKERIDQMLILAKSRALENQCWLLLTNAVNNCVEIEMGGNSIVVNPYGKVVLNLKQSISGKSFKIAKKEVLEFRNNFNALYSFSRK
ncbi:MAG: hypothetical protein OEZ22_07520 [Spirochaetia bacterium]|nr:hypothetical protein [Spirochaetia bacterium]